MPRLTLLVVLAHIAEAQSVSPQAQSEIVTRTQPAIFRTAVTEVEVPVVVRDSHGRTVAGLSREDFQLFDRGKPEPITRTTQLNSGGSSTVPGRFTAILLGDVFVPPNQFESLREAAIRQIATKLDPAERVAIFCTSGRVALDFTDDPGRLRETLERLRTPVHPPYVPDPLAMTLRYSARDLASPGTRDSFVETVGQMMRQFGMESLGCLREVVRRTSLMPGERRVALLCAGFPTSDLTIYGATIEVGLGTYKDEVIKQAIRSRVTINCLGSDGLAVGDAFGIGSSMKSVLSELSYGTGGVLFKDNNNLDEGLRRVATTPEHSYILAFSPQSLKHDGSFHPLRIVVKGRRGLDVQARLGYMAPPGAHDPAKAAEEEIREALFSNDEVNNLPISLLVGVVPAGGKVRLTLETHVSLETLHFRKQDGRHLAELTITAGLFDRNGVDLASSTTNANLSLKDEKFEDWMRNGLLLQSSFDATPGTYRVRVVVRERETGTMAAKSVVVDVH